MKIKYEVYVPTTEELPKISVDTLPSNSKTRWLQSEDILRELRQEQGDHLLENNPSLDCSEHND